MDIRDNALRQALKNVYFVSGTPCGGKSTISRLLSERYGLLLYDADERFEAHRRLSDARLQPAMNRRFEGADDFFGRSAEEYAAWLEDSTREQLDFVLLDLIRLSQGRRVVCDCHLSAEEAGRLTEPGRIVFLVKEPSRLLEDYCARPDHEGFARFLESASDPARARATCRAALLRFNLPRYLAMKRSGYRCIDRNEGLSPEETLARVERAFGWQPSAETE
ncbi:MAG: shikimate kinase [Eubacteriales bacterium]|nr:shikimate kinase [bacterium]MDY2792710.1 shikimate kinase [Eubacteriales bacterium]